MAWWKESIKWIIRIALGIGIIMYLRWIGLTGLVAMIIGMGLMAFILLHPKAYPTISCFMRMTQYNMLREMNEKDTENKEEESTK